MNIRIKKIIIAAVALLFVGSGVAFAHDRDHRPSGKAFGHYKAEKHNSGWHKGHFKSKGHHGKYVYKNVYHYDRDYGKHERRWRERHYKPKRHVYKEVHRDDRDYKKHRRYPRRAEGPEVVFKVILRDKIF
jgi:hypothetical protein